MGLHPAAMGRTGTLLERGRIAEGSSPPVETYSFSADPSAHPRVAGTLAAIKRALFIDGLVYRFDPAATLGGDQLPLGEFEGAFLPATFWFAHALAKAGRADEAEAILKQCEAIAPLPGLDADKVNGSE